MSGKSWRFSGQAIDAVLKEARVPANSTGNSAKFTKRVLQRLTSDRAQKLARRRSRRPKQ